VLVTILLTIQAIAAVGLILVGSLVEAYGYGLSLGTKWPYHQSILSLALHGDPEAWHRIIATILGINAVLILILRPDRNTIAGLVCIATTALLGMATLYVLAGKAPAFLHGLHGLLAYSTFFSYLSALQPDSPSVWSLVAQTIPLHALLLMVFLGGMVTGRRGYQRAIGEFTMPKTASQWVFAVHGVIWLVLVLTLAFYAQVYSGALVLVLIQGIVGFGLYQSVNARPKRPGIVTVVHQGMAILIALAVVFDWKIAVPFLS
jgi:hypothetical protein